MHKGSNVIAAVGFKPWRLFDAYRVLIRVKVGRDHNRQAIGKLRKFAVFALFEGLWKALGRCSSPVCRIVHGVHHAIPPLGNSQGRYSFFDGGSRSDKIQNITSQTRRFRGALWSRLPACCDLCGHFCQKKRSAPHCMSYSRERFCILSIYRLSFYDFWIYLYFSFWSNYLESAAVSVKAAVPSVCCKAEPSLYAFPADLPELDFLIGYLAVLVELQVSVDVYAFCSAHTKPSFM